MMTRVSTATRHVPVLVSLAALLFFANPAGAQTFTSFDYPGGLNTNAFSINERGDIVGRFDDADGNTHGFLLRQQHFTQIDYPRAVFTAPRDINNLGDVTGRYIDQDSISHGFLLSKGVYTSFDFPALSIRARAESTTCAASPATIV